MKAREYRERTLDELRHMEEDLKEDLFNLRFQHAAGQLDNVARLREAKRNLARVKTILRENELGVRKLLTGQGSVAGPKA